MQIFIAGDVMPTEVTEAFFDKGDVKALFGTVPDLFANADRVIINHEGALTYRETPIRKMGPNLKGKPEHAKVLKALGVTDAGLSNNHVFDYGQEALLDTEKALQDAGICTMGIGENEQAARKPHYFTIRDKKFAVLAVCEHEYSYALPDQLGTWGFDPFETMEDITNAKKEADYVFVLYHGGKEFCHYPSPRLRKACKAMVRAGADAVFCQHSHCIGAYEQYKDAHILYGQGNFNFIKWKDDLDWRLGLVVELNIDETAPNGKIEIDFHPWVITDTGITLAAGEEKEEILKQFATYTEHLQDEQTWLAEWRRFCKSKEDLYREGIHNVLAKGKDADPREIFPHFLDCEAHTDVWRELFPTWHAKKETEQK